MLDTYLVAMQDAEQYLNFLHSLSDMGAVMRQVMTQALTNPQVYANLTKIEESNTNFYKAHSQANYEAALDTLKCPPTPIELAGE